MIRSYSTEFILLVTLVTAILGYTGISALQAPASGSIASGSALPLQDTTANEDTAVPAEKPAAPEPSPAGTAPPLLSTFQSAVQEIYQVAKLLSFDFDPERLLNWQLTTAALLAVLVISGVIFNFLGRASERLMLNLLSLWGGHVVIMGLGRIGLHLARYYRGISKDADQQYPETARLVIIELDPENPHIRELRDAGAIVVVGDAADTDVLHQVRAHKASRVFAVTGNNGVNLEIAAALQPGKRGNRRGAVCHIHLSDPDQADALASAVNANQQKNTMALEVFNLYTSTSRRFLLQKVSAELAVNPLVEHFFIFGFGAQGQALARDVALLAHFANGKRSRLTIADADLSSTRDPFLHRHPTFCPAPGTLDLSAPPEGLDDWAFHGLRPLTWARYPEGQQPGAAAVPPDHTPVEYICNAEFLEIPGALDCPEFVELLARRLNRPEIEPVLVVCVEEEDRKNFEAAHQLHKGLVGLINRDLLIHVWQPRGSSLKQFMGARCINGQHDENNALTIDLEPFGEPRTICSQKAVTQPPLEDLARRIHEDYRATQTEEQKAQLSGRAWSRLPESLRQSNRLRAAHMDVKLCMLGLKRVPLGEADPARVVESIEDGDVIESIAEAEHNRWNAERLLDGWRYAPVTNKACRLHSNLVPYHQLSENIKDYDRSALAEIFRLVEEQGQCVERILVNHTGDDAHEQDPAPETCPLGGQA